MGRERVALSLRFGPRTSGTTMCLLQVERGENLILVMRGYSIIYPCDCRDGMRLVFRDL